MPGHDNSIFAQSFQNMLNSIMKVFLPKDRVFYQLFEEVAVKVLEMSRKLKEMVHEPDYDKRSAVASQIEELEHVNDDLTHKIFTELGRNPLSPPSTGKIYTTWHRHSMILQTTFSHPQKKLSSIA